MEKAQKVIGGTLEAYSTPTLRKLGGVANITSMPGGSNGIEGNSGKLHKYATGEDENKFPNPPSP